MIGMAKPSRDLSAGTFLFLLTASVAAFVFFFPSFGKLTCHLLHHALS